MDVSAIVDPDFTLVNGSVTSDAPLTTVPNVTAGWVGVARIERLTVEEGATLKFRVRMNVIAAASSTVSSVLGAYYYSARNAGRNLYLK